MKPKTLICTLEVVDTSVLGGMKEENALQEDSWSSSEEGKGDSQADSLLSGLSKQKQSLPAHFTWEQ